MKIISYSIFGSRTTPPEDQWMFHTYMRGLFFNVLMNRLVYKDWHTHIEVDAGTFSDYDHIFIGLQKQYGCSVTVNPPDTLCKMMLWRLKPIFNPDAEYVICRDTDALTSMREAKAVQQWIDTGWILHGISDNPAHNLPLMGGLSGFKCQPLREKYGSYDAVIAKSPVSIDKRGSDQDFLNKVIYEDFEGQLLGHFGDTSKVHGWSRMSIDGKSHGSDLCTAFIGSAGCNEMETIRYLKANSPDFRFEGVDVKYPLIFNWLAI